MLFARVRQLRITQCHRMMHTVTRVLSVCGGAASFESLSYGVRDHVRGVGTGAARREREGARAAGRGGAVGGPLAALRRTYCGVVRGQAARHITIFAFFSLLAFWWLRPLSWHLANHVSSTGDPLITAWRLVWPVQWLTQRPAAFWDSNVLYPASSAFARDELTLGQTLFAGPIYLLTHNALLAHNLTIVVTLALSGFTTYWLVWQPLHSRIAGVFAGIIVAFAPYHLAQVDHAGLLAVQWLPLVLLFLHRTLRSRRWRDAGGLSLFAFLQAISAGYYAYLTAFLVLAYLGYLSLAERRTLTWRGIARVVAALAVALALLVPIALPFWRVAADEGFVRSRTAVELWSAKPRMWLSATPNNLLYGAFSRRYALTWPNEVFLFPGVLALMLAGIALAGRRLHFRAAALVITLVGFVLSLGPALNLKRIGWGRLPLPYDLFYRFVPGADALRAPLRIAPLAMLGLALLAAIGWKRIAIGMRRRGLPRAATYAVALMLVGGLLAEYATGPISAFAVPQLDSAFTPVAGWLAAQPPSVVALLPNPRAAVAMTLATTDRHRFVNGEAEVRPPARRALFRRLSTFPDPASVTDLQLLGVNLVVLDRTGYSAQAWEVLPERVTAFADDLILTAALPNALVYRVTPARERYASLLAAIPARARVYVSGSVADEDALLDRALLAHFLVSEGRELRGPLETGWVTDPPPATGDPAPAFGIFARHEVPPGGYDRSVPLWADATSVVYRARGA